MHHIKNILGISLLMLLAGACSDEKLDVNGDASGAGPTPLEGYTLSFRMSLPTLGGDSRSIVSKVEEYENYVDPDKLYIFFLIEDPDPQDKKDRVFWKFEPGDPAVSMIPVSFENLDEQYEKNWYVKISIPDIENHEEFVARLKYNDFKIAVMANASPGSIKLKGSTGTSGNLTLGDDINLLHFQSNSTKDPYYLAGNTYGIDKNPYFFLFKDQPDEAFGILGQYTDWVKDRYLSLNDVYGPSDVEQWIRSLWNPTSNKNWGDYTDLRLLWNFGGKENATIPYDYFGENWEAKNGEKLREIITNTAEEDPNILEPFKTEEHISLEYIDFADGVTHAAAVKKEIGSGSWRYGVKLPKQSNAGFVNGNYNRINPADGGCLAFTAIGSGHLYITAAAPEGSAKIIAQVGKKFEHVEMEVAGEDPVTSGRLAISITGDSTPIYIFTDAGSESDAEIYQIDFIRDTYLSETDREGIKPSKEHPIEMYGVASYNAIRDLWAPGTSFDLDNYNGTSPDYPDADKTYFHPVPLLRSVAKVIVLIPKALEPHDVYLRCANRYARWEPSDVRSNTLDIWGDIVPDISQDHSKDPKCEFSRLIGLNPFYNPSENKEGQLASYQKKLAWYYGSWIDEKIMPESTPITNLALNYPHIINPLIYRSDFVQFLQTEDEEIYHKYVLYVPEKFVDDPENIIDENGIENSIPKLCHIEFRSGGDSNENLDDNNCYRIYFTTGGVIPGKTPDLRDENHTWEKAYEQNVDNIKKHWPIMRNHCYRFTVQDISNLAVIVNLEVLPWRRVKDIEVSW